MLRVCLACLIFCSVSLGDVLHLKDGSTLNGTVKRVEDHYVVISPGGQVRQVEVDLVNRIDLSVDAGAAGGKAARSNLLSLRRGADALADLDQIIARYEQFIDKHRGAEVEADARADLAQWISRRDAGLVKYGAQWVTPAERAGLQGRTMLAVSEAAAMVKEGRLKEADAALAAILADEPSNVSALYLTGLVQFRRGDIGPARKSFDLANNELPDHVPTLNNLAVTSFRQKQWGATLSLFDQAMSIQDADRVVIDNFAELLQLLPASQRDSAMAKRVIKKFDDQEPRLVQEMQSRGLYRWGAVWVDEKERMRLLAQREEVKTRVADMEKEFDKIRERISDIENDIEDNSRAMRQMEARGWARGPDGSMYRARLPSNYYEIKKDNEELLRDRDEQFAKRDALRDGAKQLQSKLQDGIYTGTLQLFGVEGTPVPLAEAPTSQPTAAPATRPGE